MYSVNGRKPKEKKRGRRLANWDRRLMPGLRYTSSELGAPITDAVQIPWVLQVHMYSPGPSTRKINTFEVAICTANTLNID